MWELTQISINLVCSSEFLKQVCRKLPMSSQLQLSSRTPRSLDLLFFFLFFFFFCYGYYSNEAYTSSTTNQDSPANARVKYNMQGPCNIISDGWQLMKGVDYSFFTPERGYTDNYGHLCTSGVEVVKKAWYVRWHCGAAGLPSRRVCSSGVDTTKISSYVD